MKYNRNILVPYLKYVKEIEMIYEILGEKKNIYSQNINLLNNQILQLRTEKTEHNQKINHFDNIKLILGSTAIALCLPIITYVIALIIYIIVGLVESLSRILGIINLDFWPESWNWVDSWKLSKPWNMLGVKITCVISILIMLASVITVIFDIKDTILQNKNNKLESVKIQKYNLNLSNIKYNELVVTKKTFENIKIEYNQVCKKRKEIYSANIIPDQYRDVYSVTYLYRYFSTSKENDLDKVIQTLLLDNIQHTLIDIKEEIISINSSFTSMNNYLNNITGKINELNFTSLENQKKIAEIEKNSELQNNYLDVIKCNTKAAAYFNAATYLNSFR